MKLAQMLYFPAVAFPLFVPAWPSIGIAICLIHIIIRTRPN